MDWSSIQEKVETLKRLVPEAKQSLQSKFNPTPVGSKTVVKDGNIVDTLKGYFNGVKDFYTQSNDQRSDQIGQFVDKFFPAQEKYTPIGNPGSNTVTNAALKAVGNMLFAGQLEDPTKFDINAPEGRQKLQDQSLNIAMNMSTPLQAKRLAKGLPPQVLSGMEDFTNYVAQVKNKVIKPDYKYEGEMRQILEDFGMNTNKSNTKLASDFADVLSEADALAMKPKYTKDALGRFTGSKSTQPKGGGIKIVEQTTDSYSGQTNNVLKAFQKDKVVGNLQYSETPNKILIDMVEVDPSQQGKGYAKQMVEKLYKENPNKKIDWGMQTESGAGLKKWAEKQSWFSFQPTKGVGGKWFSGSDTPTPSGKYTYLTPDKEYAGNFGKNISEYQFEPKNSIDFREFGQKPITFTKLKSVLEANGVKIDSSMVDENYVSGVSEPAWFWLRRYQEIVDKIATAGKDSVLLKESIGKGKGVDSAIVLSKSVVK